jgi:hypothetical protein
MMSSFASPPTITTVPSTTITIPSTLSILISENLMKTNYPLWRAQVMPALCATQFDGLLTGDDMSLSKQIIVMNDDKTTTSTTNSAYVAWVARD